VLMPFRGRPAAETRASSGLLGADKPHRALCSAVDMAETTILSSSLSLSFSSEEARKLVSQAASASLTLPTSGVNRRADRASLAYPCCAKFALQLQVHLFPVHSHVWFVPAMLTLNTWARHQCIPQEGKVTELSLQQGDTSPSSALTNHPVPSQWDCSGRTCYLLQLEIVLGLWPTLLFLCPMRYDILPHHTPPKPRYLHQLHRGIWQTCCDQLWHFAGQWSQWREKGCRHLQSSLLAAGAYTLCS